MVRELSENGYMRVDVLLKHANIYIYQDVIEPLSVSWIAGLGGLEGVVQSCPELSGVSRSCPEVARELSGVARPELPGVARRLPGSCPELSGVVADPELPGGCPGVVRSCPEWSGVGLSWPELSGVAGPVGHRSWVLVEYIYIHLYMYRFFVFATIWF